MRVNEFIGVTALFYSLANPIGVIPIFLALAKSHPKVSPRRIIVLASISVASFLTLSAISGNEILSFFHVGLDDFRIAGGLLALFVAFEMFQAKYGGIICMDRRCVAREKPRNGGVGSCANVSGLSVEQFNSSWPPWI